MRINIRAILCGVLMLSCVLVMQGQSRSALEKQKKDLQKQISKIDAAIASTPEKAERVIKSFFYFISGHGFVTK